MKGKYNLLLGILAVCLILSAGIGSATAYFTTYSTAEGGQLLDLGDSTKIEEQVSNWTKHLKISSDKESEPVFVRARAICGSQYALVYSGGDGWSDGGDGWWYYGPILYAEGSTTVLDVKIENIPEDAKEGDSFNVVVYYQSTPVLYDENGTPYADWSLAFDNE